MGTSVHSQKTHIQWEFRDHLPFAVQLTYFTQELNADLQLLSIPHTFWKYISAQKTAHLAVLAISLWTLSFRFYRVVNSLFYHVIVLYFSKCFYWDSQIWFWQTNGDSWLYYDGFRYPRNCINYVDLRLIKWTILYRFLTRTECHI